MTGVLAPPFDAVAPGYDPAFTDQLLGRWLREAVHERLARAFATGSHVLELGCGTGEDAVLLARRGVRVTATDASGAMLAEAEAKVARAGLTGHVSLARLDLGAPPDAASLGRFDGAFSNFGAVNCVGDRRPLWKALAGAVVPGGQVVLVVMGPLCAWEVGWHLAHARPSTAFRRLRAGAPAHVGAGARTPVWYPSPRRLRGELEPWFAHRETSALGVLLPPSYLASLVARRPRAFDLLRRVERRLARRFPAAWLADHYVSVFGRR
ncbi:MAG: class I SAM-dependent methyltransferase [Gaiellaceae bacterium]